ncbi:hypothetical protein HED50_03040 [Ochrobactrum oryzae]|nr:hypothetical protein [Brucella oryzae]
MDTNPSIFGSSQKRGVLIPICSRSESGTFRESEVILTLPEVCQQSDPALAGFLCRHVDNAAHNIDAYRR